MASGNFRRGPEAIRAAAGQMDVHEQVEAAGLRILGQSGPWLFHQCPNFDDHARGDRHPSAQSNVETGYWQCFGCDARGRWPGVRSGAPALASGRAPDVPGIGPVEPFVPAPTRETSWDYRDEDGRVVYRMIRIPRGDDPGGKSFFVRHPNERGTWVEGKPGSGFVLYRLPELIEAVAAGEAVYVAEGEKDADSLAAAGVAATCNTGGANKPREWEAHAHYLAGADVVIVADRDRAGLRHALDVREKLRGVAASVAIRLPAVGKDVSDHLHNGRTLGELVPFEPDNVRPSGNPGGADGRTLHDVSEDDGFVLLSDEDVTYEPPRWLWENWVVLGNLNVLAGDGGCGKSHFMLGMAARLSRGDLPGDHKGQPGCTIYLSAEDDLARLKGLYRAAGGEPGRLLHVLVPRDGYDDHPTLPADMPTLRRAVERSGASLVDPGMSFFEVRDSHNDQAMRRAVFGPLARLAMDTGAAVVFVVHLNKNSAALSFRQRINGAVGLTNAPRSVIGMARDPEEPDDRSVVAHVKGNLTKTPSSLIFEFVETEMVLDGQDTAVTHLKLAGACGLAADDLVRPPARERETKADRVDEAVLAALETGAQPSEELRAQVEADLGEKVSRQALSESRQRLGLVQWWERKEERRVSYTGREGDEPDPQTA